MPEQMADYGGGGAPPTSQWPRYFYLVVKSSNKNQTLDPIDIQKFFRTGVNTDENYRFSLVDIASDQRLKQDMLKMEGGASLYERLEAQLPAFIISFFGVPQIAGIPQMTVASFERIYPIRDYDCDVQVIYDQMGLEPPSARKAAIDFMKKVNRYFQLKPSIFGIGANVNDIISDLIERLERSLP